MYLYTISVYLDIIKVQRDEEHRKEIMMKMTYGHSMYGGWYAHDAAMKVNLKTDTLKELKEICKANGYALIYRFDN